MNDKQTILLVGRGLKSQKQYILDKGYEYVVLTDKRLLKNPDKKFKRRVVRDLSVESELLDGIKEVKQRFQISAVIASYENYILPAAVVAKELGLPGMPVEAAQACTDKFLMRQKFSRAPKKISPGFAIVKQERDVIDFANQHKFPLILKPANLAKSLLVTKCHDMEELVKNYRETTAIIHDIYKKYAPSRQPKLIIEEFMEGPIHSVDAFVDNSGQAQVLGQVVDYQTGYDIGFDDNFHYSRILPSKLPEETVEQIRETAKLGCETLGMKNSPAHVEIILTQEGPMIVEIGARNGGYRERMHRLANSLDLNGIFLDLMLGKKPRIEANKNDHCAVLELFPKLQGEFSHISNQAELEALPSFVSLNLKVKPGDKVGKAAHGHKMCAVVVLHNENEKQFNSDLEYVDRHVYAVAN